MSGSLTSSLIENKARVLAREAAVEQADRDYSFVVGQEPMLDLHVSPPHRDGTQTLTFTAWPVAEQAKFAVAASNGTDDPPAKHCADTMTAAARALRWFLATRG